MVDLSSSPSLCKPECGEGGMARHHHWLDPSGPQALGARRQRMQGPQRGEPEAAVGAGREPRTAHLGDILFMGGSCAHGASQGDQPSSLWGLSWRAHLELCMVRGAKPPGWLGKAYNLYHFFPGESAHQGEELGILGVFSKHDLGKVVFRTPETGRLRLSLLRSSQSEPRCTLAGARPGAQRWHVAPTLARLPQPQAGTSAELSQRSGLPSLEVECPSPELFRRSSFRVGASVLPAADPIWSNYSAAS